MNMISSGSSAIYFLFSLSIFLGTCSEDSANGLGCDMAFPSILALSVLLLA
jgi:hypothetical protein